jgi:hypothetical protein
LARLALDFAPAPLALARFALDFARLCGRFAAPEPDEPLLERAALLRDPVLLFRCPLPDADLLAAIAHPPNREIASRWVPAVYTQ